MSLWIHRKRKDGSGTTLLVDGWQLIPMFVMAPVLVLFVLLCKLPAWAAWVISACLTVSGTGYVATVTLGRRTVEQGRFPWEAILAGSLLLSLGILTGLVTLIMRV